MEPGGSVQRSEQPSVGPYPEPDESSPYHFTIFPYYFLPVYTQVLCVNSSLY